MSRKSIDDYIYVNEHPVESFTKSLTDTVFMFVPLVGQYRIISGRDKTFKDDKMVGILTSSYLSYCVGYLGYIIFLANH